jgi:FkbM family methyltransferase
MHYKIIEIKNLTKRLIYRFVTILLPNVFKIYGLKRFKKHFNKETIDQEFEILPYLISRDSIVIDIGANQGEYCYFFQENVKAKSIFAFEPIPALYERLTILFPRINSFPYAVSNLSKQTELRIPVINNKRNESRAKLDDLVEENETTSEKILVQTITLDEFFLSADKPVDFIKIDIEGHELNAIRGGKKLILRDKPILMVELEYRHHTDNFQRVIEEVCELGYNCYFYDKSEKKLISISQFSVEKHQNLNSNNYYVHNLFFIPFNVSIDHLNAELKS